MIRPIENMTERLTEPMYDRLIGGSYAQLSGYSYGQATDRMKGQPTDYLSDKTVSYSIIQTFKRTADRMNDPMTVCLVFQSANKVNNQPNV